jgi:hypothetical protein
MKDLVHRRPAQVLVLFALGLLALFAFVGLALDLGMLYLNRRVVQTAADSAVIAAAARLSEPAPVGSSTKLEVARAACMYAQTNNVRSWTTLSVVEYIGADSQPIGTNVFVNDPPPCPTPNPATGACYRPPTSACTTITDVQVNTIPGAAAGIHVRTSQTFPTNIMGMFGIPNFTVIADATARVEWANGGANAAYIACGNEMTLDASPINFGANAINPGNQNPDTGSAWSTYFTSPISVLNGNSSVGYTVRKDNWHTYNAGGPSGVAATYPKTSQKLDANALIADGVKPFGPPFTLFGNDVQGKCNTANGWKGLSCVASSACLSPPNPSCATCAAGKTNQLLMTLPAPAGGDPNCLTYWSLACPPYSTRAGGDNGNGAGMATQTLGPNGCRSGANPIKCVSLMPLSIGGPPGTLDTYAVAWAPFWLDDCFKSDGNHQTCGWLLGDYTLFSGPTTAGWTYGFGAGGGITAIKVLS